MTTKGMQMGLNTDNGFRCKGKVYREALDEVILMAYMRWPIVLWHCPMLRLQRVVLVLCAHSFEERKGACSSLRYDCSMVLFAYPTRT